MNSTRRAFLQQVGTVVGSYFCIASTPRANPKETGALVESLEYFPQGVASGDPLPNSVVVWTRIEPDEHKRFASANLEVSLVADFSELIVSAEIPLSAESDHTCSVLVSQLLPDSVYFYRFILDNKLVSRVGRTKTAPSPLDKRSVRLAWACCQDYEAGYHHGWRIMIEKDLALPNNKQLDAVLHLGDFIYESIGAKFTDEFNRDFLNSDGYLTESDGKPRKIENLPSGGVPGRFGGRAATDLADYRHIYRAYLGDSDLQEARARWPFICTWDDHEFSDNSWQDNTYNEHNPALRAAASQAWFEFVPMVTKPRFIVNALDKKIPKSINIDSPLTRDFAFGETVSIIVTDNRLFRDEPNGKGETLLGNTQKAWWKKRMSGSSATWKLWANSVPLTPMYFSRTGEDDRCDTYKLQSSDAWSGYQDEKSELLGYIKSKGIRNVISLSGDYHASIQSDLFLKDDSQNRTMVASEFAIGALSSTSFFRIMKLIAPKGSVRKSKLNKPDGDRYLDKLITQSNSLDYGCEVDQKIGYADSKQNAFGWLEASSNELYVEYILFESIRPGHPKPEDLTVKAFRQAAREKPI